jgi:hypothetical protein
MNQPQIFNIQLGAAGLQLVLNALAKMPFEQVVELINVIRMQAEQQLNPQPAAPATAEPVPAAGDNEGATAD